MLRKFFRDESGMETVEWAVLLGLILAGVIGVVLTLGPKVTAKFSAVDTALP
ncbi:Flp family type IVb pilin [bacterium]|nr:Flp family type IVb pilin [bacterium]